MDRPIGPYVVTEDLSPLLGTWARRKGFTLPGPEFFQDLRTRLIADLRLVLSAQYPDPEILYLPFAELRQQAAAGLAAHPSDVPLVTLDHHYFPTIERVVDVTRLSEKKPGGWRKLRGVGTRVDCPSVEEQIAAVSRSLPVGTETIGLVDDGLWSGTTTLAVADLFWRHCGIRTDRIMVALMVESPDTADRLLEVAHPSIISLARRFPLRQGGVIDWICERDWYMGVPLGGRTVGPESRPYLHLDVGAYYLDPFDDKFLGDPADWASLDGPAVAAFSRRRIEDAIELFEAVSAASQRPVLSVDLERWPYGVPFNPQLPFARALRNLLKQ